MTCLECKSNDWFYPRVNPTKYRLILETWGNEVTICNICGNIQLPKDTNELVGEREEVLIER